MRCIRCGNRTTKVVDSRPADDDASIRRRRECMKCGYRFTTLERATPMGLSVIKRDGTKEPYTRDKVVGGMEKALTNRPVTDQQIARLADRVEERLRRKGPDVTSQEVGLEILTALRKLDEVAYLRFASVYKDFQELTDFERELGLLLQKRQPKRRTVRKR
ncbi:MAG TPA: transcriptional regulator NrdR [Actinomycetota bacterium]|nr:transcriptional regulator NrdR [Actinomycetota bacterium]